MDRREGHEEGVAWENMQVMITVRKCMHCCCHLHQKECTQHIKFTDAKTWTQRGWGGAVMTSVNSCFEFLFVPFKEKIANKKILIIKLTYTF